MNEKLNIMYNLLSEQNFTIISEINDDFKCVICKNVLMNAQQSLCGCHFCQVCIDNYKSSGCKTCPGNTDECQSDELSNISVDHRMNKRISNLIVSCPREICFYECRLIEMEDHMKFCSTINANCPFFNFGCDHEEMDNDKLNKHMLLEIVNHNKILIDIIGNLRNEIRELKEKDEIILTEIEILKFNDGKKDEQIVLLRNEIKLIKKDNHDIIDQNEKNYCHFDNIDMETKDKCTYDIIKSIKDEIELLKIEKEKLSQQIDILNRKFDDEMNVRLNEMKKEWEEKLEIQNTTTNEINKYLNWRDNGDFLWQIGKISEIDLMFSGIFYDKQTQCKMQLALQNENDELQIILINTSDEIYNVNIEIKLVAYEETFIEKSFIKLLQINKPEFDSSEIIDSSDSLEIGSFRSVSVSSEDSHVDDETNTNQSMIGIVKVSHFELTESKHFNKNCWLTVSLIHE